MIDIKQQGQQIKLEAIKAKPEYTLGQLIAQCDLSAPPDKDGRDWDKAPFYRP
jgi:hypothetical protein